MAWTSPKTWATNDIMTATDMNTYVRDNENAIGKLTSFTPTWTAATTNPSIGNGVLQGRYIALEEWVWISITVVAGSTTTYGSGAYSLALPFPGSSLLGGAEQNVLGAYNDLGVTRYIGAGIIFSGASTLLGWFGGVWSPTVPTTMGNTDTVQFSGMYRRV